MDNKKWYKRISTCFWFLLATLPLFVALIRFIFMWFIHTDSLSFTDIQSFIDSNTLASSFDASKTYFLYSVPPFLRNAFRELFTQMGCDYNVSLVSFSVTFCSWFCWVYFIELMVDFVVWLPRMCHSWIERWCVD